MILNIFKIQIKNDLLLRAFYNRQNGVILHSHILNSKGNVFGVLQWFFYDLIIVYTGFIILVYSKI